LWVFLILSAGSAHAQNGLQLSVADGSALALAPGSVGSRPVQLLNTGAGPVTARLRPDLPSGWSLLIPPPSVVLEAGGRASQLLTFTVPSDTASGPYEIRLTTDSEGVEPLVLPVDVLARPQVSAEWLSEPDLVRAGSRIEATLRITNTGNAATEWVIGARSSLALPVDVEPGGLTLEAGKSASITVRVGTSDDITNRLTHVATVAISVLGGNAPLRQLSLTTDIYPSRASSRRQTEGTLPATLTTTATSEDGTHAAQVTFRIPETELEGRLVEALIRIPDARQQSTFSQPDRYAFRLASPGWSLKLGDHNWDATDLLEVGSLGFGAGGDYRMGRFRTGGFVQRSRRIFPEQQQAFAFASMAVRDNLSMGVNALAKRTYEEGQSASIGLMWEPGVQMFSAEVAQGWFGDETGRAAQVDMTLQHKQSMVTLQAEAADDGFLGAIRGARGGALSTRVVLSDGLRWTTQARVRERRYDLGEAGRATQTFGLGRTALTLLRSRDRYRASWTVSAQGQINNNTLTSLRREEQAIESRLTLNRRRFGVNALVRRGQSEDPSRTALDPYLASQVSLFGTRRSLSINTSVSWLDGPTFYNPVDQQRVNIGVNLGWDNGRGSRVTLGGLHSEDRLSASQSFSMADARIEHEFSFGHLLTLRARTVRTAYETSIRNASVSASWSIPIGIPVPGMGPERAVLPGRVVDAETGDPVVGARLSMGRFDTTTDEEGRFTIRIEYAELQYLTIDRASIGFGRRPLAAMPMAIDPAMIPPEGIEIPVVRSSEVTIQVAVDTGTGGQRESALNTALGEEDKAGVLVEIRSAHDRLRRVTDRDGRARFPDLVPGVWEAFIVGASLPPETVSRPDTLQLELMAGEASEGVMTIAPERREVRLVGSGGVSLSGGIRAVESVGLSVEREEPTDDTPRVQPPVEGADPASGLPATHTVVEGETLYRLARRYYHGSHLHWIRIWEANRDRIAHPDVIVPGQKLEIPPAGALTPAEKQALKARQQSQDSGS